MEMQTAREVIVDESDFFDSSDIPDADKNARLLFLFMKDLMSAANGTDPVILLIQHFNYL